MKQAFLLCAFPLPCLVCDSFTDPKPCPLFCTTGLPADNLHAMLHFPPQSGIFLESQFRGEIIGCVFSLLTER